MVQSEVRLSGSGLRCEVSDACLLEGELVSPLVLVEE